MGETISETRLEISAQREALSATAADLRHALDLPARFRENPLPVVGMAAATIFLLTGGPKRVLRMVRRRLQTPGAAQDQLPPGLRAWTEALAGRDTRARDELAEELLEWRRGPMRSGRRRKALAKEMVEGPPGPWRAAWTAAEAGLTVLAAALARRAVERLLTDEQGAPQPAAATSTATPSGEQVGSEPGTRASSYAGRSPAG